MKGILQPSYLSILVLTVIIGCKKVATLTSDSQVAQDISVHSKLSNNLQSMVQQTVQSKSITSLKTNHGSDINGAIITIDSSNKQNIIYTAVFDGQSIGTSGIAVAGTLIVTTNGKKFNEDGMTATAKTKGLVIDGIKFNDDLEMVFTNLPTSSGFEDIWSITQKFSVIMVNGKTMSVNGSGKRYQTSGMATMDNYGDDGYKLEFALNGTATNAVVFDITTSSMLVKNPDCKHISGGVILWNSNSSKKTIDFGNSATCDNSATLNVDGVDTKFTF